jgi:hypothetical protein
VVRTRRVRSKQFCKLTETKQSGPHFPSAGRKHGLDRGSPGAWRILRRGDTLVPHFQKAGRQECRPSSGPGGEELLPRCFGPRTRRARTTLLAHRKHQVPLIHPMPSVLRASSATSAPLRFVPLQPGLFHRSIRTFLLSFATLAPWRFLPSFTDHRSPITDHRSPVTDHRSPITRHFPSTLPFRPAAASLNLSARTSTPLPCPSA